MLRLISHLCYSFPKTSIYGIRSLSVVSNKDQIFDEIDNIIKKRIISNTQNPPTNCHLQYIFTQPLWVSLLTNFSQFKFNSAANPYGHAGIAYKTPTMHKVMNVTGHSSQPLINFIDPVEYFFTDYQHIGNQQKGIFNRSFLTVRIDNVDEQIITKLDNYYKNLDEQNKKGRIKYGTILYIFTNWFKKKMGLPIRGNCAYWVSSGLHDSKIINGISSWPLFLFFKVLLTQISLTQLSNINIISYRSIKYKQEPKGSLMYPLFWLKASYKPIWNLGSFANIIVEPTITKNNNGENEYNATIREHNKDKYQKIVNNWLDLKKKFNF